MPKRKSSRRPQPRSRKADSIDCLDKTADSCRIIRALAELLFRCQSQALHTESIAVAGALILDETEKLKASLDKASKNDPRQ